MAPSESTRACDSSGAERHSKTTFSRSTSSPVRKNRLACQGRGRLLGGWLDFSSVLVPGFRLLHPQRGSTEAPPTNHTAAKNVNRGLQNGCRNKRPGLGSRFPPRKFRATGLRAASSREPLRVPKFDSHFWTSGRRRGPSCKARSAETTEVGPPSVTPSSIGLPIGEAGETLPAPGTTAPTSPRRREDGLAVRYQTARLPVDALLEDLGGARARARCHAPVPYGSGR